MLKHTFFQALVHHVDSNFNSVLQYCLIPTKIRTRCCVKEMLQILSTRGKSLKLSLIPLIL